MSESRYSHTSVSTSYVGLACTSSYLLSSKPIEVFTHTFVENPDYGNKMLPISSSYNGVWLDAQDIIKCGEKEAQINFIDDYARYVAGILDWANLPEYSESVSCPTHIAPLLMIWQSLDGVTPQQFAERNQCKLTEAIHQHVETFAYGGISKWDATVRKTSSHHLSVTGTPVSTFSSSSIPTIPEQGAQATASSINGVRLKCTTLLDFYVSDSNGSHLSQLNPKSKGMLSSMGNLLVLINLEMLWRGTACLSKGMTDVLVN